MCRRNQLIAAVVAAFGAALLIGMWIDGGFLAHCLGFGMLVFGLLSWCRRS